MPEDVKEERWHRFMAAQQEISAGLLAAKVGRKIPVLIDEVGDDGAEGRSMWDAPEIDGAVFIDDATGLKPGDIVEAEIVSADDYDLTARLVS